MPSLKGHSLSTRSVTFTLLAALAETMQGAQLDGCQTVVRGCHPQVMCQPWPAEMEIVAAAGIACQWAESKVIFVIAEEAMSAAAAKHLVCLLIVLKPPEVARCDGG